jgi:CreA protein
MQLRFVFVLCLFLLCTTARAEELDCVTTEWKMLGANHKVCVYAFEDPDIPSVTCYLSQARTGGISGAVGVAEDPSEFSIECTQIGPGTLPDKLPKSKKVFSEGTSLIFKDTTVTRLWDAKRKALVYLAVSRKIIAGSPKNALSTVVLR